MKEVFNTLLNILKDCLAKKLPNCDEITRSLGESLDKQLSFWNRFILKLHLFTCDACGRYLHHLGFLRDTLRDHDNEIADPDAAFRSEYRRESKERLKLLLTATTID